MSEQVARPRDMADEEPDMHDAESIVAALREMISAERERELAHDHHWECLGVNLPDTPEHPRMMLQAMTGVRTTYVLLRCEICLWPASVSLGGHWTEDQVRGVLNAGTDTTTD